MRGVVDHVSSLDRIFGYSGTSHIRMGSVEGADRERKCRTGLVQLDVLTKRFTHYMM